MEAIEMGNARLVRTARWFFLLAGVYGVLVIGPMFFVTPAIMPKAPQQQPEMYYGFASVTFAWQIVFFVIASDPRRYRPIMVVAAVFEKFLFVGILTVLMARHVAGLHWLPAAGIDFGLGCGFLSVWWGLGIRLDKR